MFRSRRYRKATNYERSNSIRTVEIRVQGDMAIAAQRVLIAKETAQRQRCGDILLDILADAAAIDIVTLKVSEARQYHKKAGGRTVFKQYGYYRPKSKYIYITNRTAVRGQILASKTFLDTLLHEWVHHYDSVKLKLNSIHTSGFYARIADIKTKLNVR